MASSWLPIKDHPDVYFSATMKELFQLLWICSSQNWKEKKSWSFQWRFWRLTWFQIRMTNISFRIYHTFGSDNEEKGEKKLKIQLNEYYAIAYDSKHDQQGLYIGRVLGFHDKNLGLDEISSLSKPIQQFIWLAPKKMKLIRLKNTSLLDHWIFLELVLSLYIIPNLVRH